MLTEAIEAAIVAEVQATHPEAYIVDMALIRGKKTVLSIKVDTDSGISLAECTQISRAIGHMLEDKTEMDFAYRLEVSSPGIGSPIKMTRQFAKNIGRYFQVMLEDGTIHQGKLETVTEDSLNLSPMVKKVKGVVQKKKGEAALPVDIERKDIKEAKIILPF